MSGSVTLSRREGVVSPLSTSEQVLKAQSSILTKLQPKPPSVPKVPLLSPQRPQVAFYPDCTSRGWAHAAFPVLPFSSVISGTTAPRDTSSLMHEACGFSLIWKKSLGRCTSIQIFGWGGRPGGPWTRSRTRARRGDTRHDTEQRSRGDRGRDGVTRPQGQDAAAPEAGRGGRDPLGSGRGEPRPRPPDLSPLLPTLDFHSLET